MATDRFESQETQDDIDALGTASYYFQTGTEIMSPKGFTGGSYVKEIVRGNIAIVEIYLSCTGSVTYKKQDTYTDTGLILKCGGPSGSTMLNVFKTSSMDNLISVQLNSSTKHLLIRPNVKDWSSGGISGQIVIPL